jgi:hypothetical protein
MTTNSLIECRNLNDQTHNNKLLVWHPYRKRHHRNPSLAVMSVETS